MSRDQPSPACSSHPPVAAGPVLTTYTAPAVAKAATTYASAPAITRIYQTSPSFAKVYNSAPAAVPVSSVTKVATTYSSAPAVPVVATAPALTTYTSPAVAKVAAAYTSAPAITRIYQSSPTLTRLYQAAPTVTNVYQASPVVVSAPQCCYCGCTIGVHHYIPQRTSPCPCSSHRFDDLTILLQP
ncbi:hypothetical protein MTO96_019679 [Rhipicephalus appendiculatus]